MKAFIWAVMLGVLAASIQAAVIEQLNITDTFVQDFKIREEAVMIVPENEAGSVELGVPPDAFDVEVNGKKAEVTDSKVQLALNCVFCKVRLTYTVPSRLEMKEDHFGFFKNFEKYDVKFLNYKLVLPQGYGLGEVIKGQPGVYPSPARVSKEQGRVVLEWHEVSPELPKTYYIRMHESSQGWQSWLRIILAVVGVVVGVSVIRQKLTKNKRKRKKEQKKRKSEKEEKVKEEEGEYSPGQIRTAA